MAKAQTVAELQVLIDADMKKLMKKFDKLERKLKKTKRGFSKLGKELLKFFAFRKILQGTVALFKAAFQQEMQFRKLEKVLEATSDSVRITAKELGKMATVLQRTTIFTRKEVLQAQTLAATFINIRGIQFKETVQGVLDLATAMGTGVRQAALQLSKVLNNPIQLLGALRRSGVSFTEQQGKMIKSMFKMGDVTGAQNKILTLLRDQGLKQTAQAMRDTFGGALKGLGNDLQQFGIDMINGVTASDGMTDALQTMSEAVQQASDDFLEFSASGNLDIWLANVVQSIKRVGKVLSGSVKAWHALWKGFFMNLVHLTTFRLSFIVNLFTLKFGQIITEFKKLQERMRDPFADFDKQLEKTRASLAKDDVQRQNAVNKAIEKQFKHRMGVESKLRKKKARELGNVEKAVKKVFKAGDAEDIRGIMQRAVLGAKAAGATVASIVAPTLTPPTSATITPSVAKETSRTTSVLREIVTEIKLSNVFLKAIRDGENFVVS